MRDQPNGGSSRRLIKTKTPGIYRRGNRYVVVWRYKGRQHKEYFESLEEAREAKGRRMGRDRRKPTRVRVRDYAPRWIEAYRGRTKRGFDESTRREYRREVEWRILPYFGGFYLDEIDAGDVREWFRWLEEKRGCSAAGVRKAKAALSPMLADAKEERLTLHNPVSGVRYVPREPEEEKEKPRALRREELDAFFAALPERWRLFFILLAHSGMRVGEALGLTWRNVHRGDDPHLGIREQVYNGRRKGLKSTHSARTIPLSPELARQLQRWYESSEFTAPGDPVFPNHQGGALNYHNLYNRVFKPAREACGFEWPKGIAFHEFRRTAASLLHHHGKSGRQVCDWLGHHDPAFTIKTYVGQVDEGLGDAGFLDELIPPAVPANNIRP